jgi:transcription initiation factor IIE alpha subunit
MADERATQTGQLIMCSNEKCRQLTYASDLKENGGKCPYCGEQVWETEKSKQGQVK